MTPLRWAIVAAAVLVLLAYSLLPGRPHGAGTTPLTIHFSGASR